MPQAATMVGANFPELGKDTQERFFLGYNDTTLETAEWTFPAPSDWDVTTSPTAVVCYRMDTATTGDVDVEVQVEAISDGDALDTGAASGFDTVNNVNGTTVPGTAGYIDQITVTLTNHDTSVAGDMIRIRVTFPVAGTATGDIELLWVDIRDAA